MANFQLQRNGDVVTLVAKYDETVERKELIRSNSASKMLAIPKGVTLTSREEKFIEENTEFQLY